MNVKISFEMGVKCAASVYMGDDFLDLWHVLYICKSTESELQSI